MGKAKIVTAGVDTLVLHFKEREGWGKLPSQKSLVAHYLARVETGSGSADQ
jgi:hypothetical protein